MVRLLPYLEYAKRTITHLEPAALIGLGALVLLIVLSVSLSLENETNSFNSTVMTIIYFLLIISVSGQLLYYFRSSKTNQKKYSGVTQQNRSLKHKGQLKVILGCPLRNVTLTKVVKHAWRRQTNTNQLLGASCFFYIHDLGQILDCNAFLLIDSNAPAVLLLQNGSTFALVQQKRDPCPLVMKALVPYEYS